LNSPPLPDSTFAWDQYWRDGRLASCGGEGGANYQPAIAEGWRRFFNTLPDGARVLDVCTGNGAVARLAAEAASARNHHVIIDAVDSAAIHPVKLGSHADMIRFSPRICAEELPFPDACFDVIVGQYAIEYTDVERTLAELKRVSRQTADIRFVTHASGSVVVQEAKRQLDEAERLMATGVFEAAEVLAKASALTPNEQLEARRHFHEALQSLQLAARSAADLTMYQNVGTVIVHAIQHQHLVGSRLVLDKISETATAIRAHQGRLSAMRQAALDASGAQALSATAERLWARKFELERLVRSDGAEFGWVLASKKNRAESD
jgi:ubiquinone/menaquinone biosynthesis C-methylase UbiE